MPLIEGIGDEVTVAAVVMTLVMTFLIAWWSTFVGERPLHVHIIRRSSRSSRRQRQNEHDTQQGGTEADERSTETTDGDDRNASDSTPSEDSQTTEDVTENTHEERHHVLGDQQETADTTQNVSTQKITIETAGNISSEGDVEIIGAVADDESTARTPDEHIGTELRNRRTGGLVCRNENQEIPVNDNASQNNSDLLTRTDTGSSGVAAENENDVSDVSATERSMETDTSEQDEPDSSDRNDDQAPRHESREQGADVGEEGDARVQDEVPAGHMRVRLKFLNESERMVFARPQDTLGQFRREKFAQEILAGRTVRFIFNGQLLRDDNQTLLDSNINDNSVLHCHISHAVSPQVEPSDVQNADIDLGRFMVPLFGFILLSVWYLRWQYRYMFNSTSTIALIAVSLLFALAVLAAWRS